MRCLLQATLAYDAETPLALIEEMCERVKEAERVSFSPGIRVTPCTILILCQTDKPFPPVELEWLVTTAFNHGVDLYVSNDDVNSEKWIGHAFNLASSLKDGGVLEKQLQDHYTRLTWA